MTDSTPDPSTPSTQDVSSRETAEGGEGSTGAQEASEFLSPSPSPTTPQPPSSTSAMKENVVHEETSVDLGQDGGLFSTVSLVSPTSAARRVSPSVPPPHSSPRAPSASSAESPSARPPSPPLSSLHDRRSSLLLANIAKQLHPISTSPSFTPGHSKRSSIDGAILLREEFDRIRTSHSSPRDATFHLKSPTDSVRRGGETDLWGEKRVIREEDGEGERAGKGEREGEEDAMVDEPLNEHRLDQEEDEDLVDWSFWGEVVTDYEGVARNHPGNLSKAIQNGIPSVIRGSMWQLMCASKDPDLEATYQSLLRETSPHEKSIQKDLARTFPSHKFFQRPKTNGNGGAPRNSTGNGAADTAEDRGRGQEELYNVVRAYSLYDPGVGYVQGTAFIVAALLLNMPDEEAFCVLVRLMHSYGLRTMFISEMPGLQLRLYQLERLLEEIVPLLHFHFVRTGVKSSMYAGQWFLTLFAYRFPLNLVYRIFDIIFAEGIEAVFRFALALLIKNEEELLKLDFEGILKYLQSSLFDSYKVPKSNDGATPTATTHAEKEAEDEDEVWRANEFVQDAFSVRITPFQLDGFTAEWDEKCRVENSHKTEVDQLRNANRNLSAQIKQLESSLSLLNSEHVEMVNNMIKQRIEAEELRDELVRVKFLYAELSHTSESSKQRSSTSSFWSLSGRSSSSKGDSGLRTPPS